MEILRKKKYLAIAGLVIVLLGVFTPYFTASAYGYKISISMLKYWEGYVVLVMLISAAGYIFKDEISSLIPSFGSKLEKYKNPKIVLVPVGVITLVALYLTIDYFSNSSYLKGYIHLGIGFYLLWIGIVCLIAHGILYKPDVVAEPVATPAPNPGVEAPVQPAPVAPEQPVAPQPVPEQPVEPQPAVKTCTQCGCQMDINATVCPVCGRQM